MQNSQSELKQQQVENRELDHSVTQFKLQCQDRNLEVNKLQLSMESLEDEQRLCVLRGKELETKLIKANATIEMKDQLLARLSFNKH